MTMNLLPIVPAHRQVAAMLTARTARVLLCIAAVLAGLSPVLQAQNTHRAALVRASSQYFSASDSTSLSVTGDLTVELWAKPPSLNNSTNYTLASKDGVSPQRGWVFRIAVDGSGNKSLGLDLSANGSTVTTRSVTAPVLAGAWQHFALVYSASAGSVSFYLNGVLQSTAQTGLPTSNFDNSAAFAIGAGNPSVPDYFDGFADDVRVWSVVRTQPQIQTAMFAELTGAESGLRGYWRLNNSVADATANGNTLTNPNGATFQTNDLPFTNSALPLEWCQDKDTKALFHFEGSTVSVNGSATLNYGGGLTFGAGKFGSAADFGTNNTTKSLSTTDPLGIDGGPVTMSCWIRLNSEISSGIYTFLDQANISSKANYIIDYQFNGGARQIGFHRAKPGVTDQFVLYPVTLGTAGFHLLTLTYDGATLTGYLDGVSAGSIAASGNGTAAGTAGVGVGIRNFSGGDRASAVIDEVLFSSRAMSGEEVMKYYGGIVSARFNSDANPESATVDGMVQSAEYTAWAPAHDNAVGSIANDSSPTFSVLVGDGSTASYNPYIVRAYALFDTSSLPDSVAVSRSSLRLYATAKSVVDVETPNDNINVCASTPASSTALVPADFGQCGALSNPPLFSSGRLSSQITLNAYNEWEFNDTGRAAISKTGISKLGIRTGYDLSNTPMPDDQVGSRRRSIGVTFQSADSGTNKPYLLVEYQQAGGPASYSISGTISVTNPPAGTIRITASSTGTAATDTRTLTAPGPYNIPSLPGGQSYNVTAYIDANGNGVKDASEWSGSYTGNPLLLDANKTGIDIAIVPPVPGTVDSNFAPNATNVVYCTTVQPDGKIVAGGAFTTMGGVTRNYFARLNADGSLDGSFNPNANSYVICSAIQTNGQIVIGGSFTAVGGTAHNYIARLNADGTVDASFNPSANGPVQNLAIQADGKIVIGGTFNVMGGVSRNGIARLNADGTLDVGFNPNAGSGSLSYGIVYSAAIQPDGKIVIGGNFNLVGGVSRNYIARLNADGTLDLGFNPNANANNVVNSTAIQADGKIVIGGLFIFVNGSVRNHIARLNADGSLDAGFDPNSNGEVYSLAIQTDGKIVIAGVFSNLSGMGWNYLARVNADGSSDIGFNPNPNGGVLSTACRRMAVSCLVGHSQLWGAWPAITWRGS